MLTLRFSDGYRCSLLPAAAASFLWGHSPRWWNSLLLRSRLETREAGSPGLWLIEWMTDGCFSFSPVPQLLAFLQGLFTFYHEGYELAHEFEPYKQHLQFNLQNVSFQICSWFLLWKLLSNQKSKWQSSQGFEPSTNWLANGSLTLWTSPPQELCILLNRFTWNWKVRSWYLRIQLLLKS